MAYTKGVIETAIQNIVDRLWENRDTENGRLKDVKYIFVGHRQRSTGDNALPRIVINIIDYNETTVTIANSMSQKTGKLKLEFRLQTEKLKSTESASYQDNVLFDTEGNGAIPFFQNFVDSLIYDANGVYKPWLDMQLDEAPNASFIVDETGNSMEIVVDVTFAIRYTSGMLGGNYSA